MSPPCATTSSRFWVCAWAGRASGPAAAAAPAAAAPCRSVRLESFMLVPPIGRFGRYGIGVATVNADGSGRVPAVEIASIYRTSAGRCQGGDGSLPRIGDGRSQQRIGSLAADRRERPLEVSRLADLDRSDRDGEPARGSLQ